MLPLERQRKIIDRINQNSTVKVTALSKEFDVTEETIRKDLEKLEKQGVLKRSYGGAVLVNAGDTPFEDRVCENSDAKNKIGVIVSNLIEDDEIIMLDSSTTCLAIAKNIPQTKSGTIITNGIGAILQMGSNESITVISTGGTLRHYSMSLIGPTARANIENCYADKAIISCKGIDETRGIMDANELEIEIKRAMIMCAKEVVLVIDSNKLEKSSLYKLADLSMIDMIVMDKKPSRKWVDLFQKYSIKLITEE